jgi:hypothetical protein
MIDELHHIWLPHQSKLAVYVLRCAAKTLTCALPRSTLKCISHFTEHYLNLGYGTRTSTN